MGGPADEYEAVALPVRSNLNSAVFVRRSKRPSRRAVLHLHELADSLAPSDLVRWYNERGFHFYLTDVDTTDLVEPGRRQAGQAASGGVRRPGRGLRSPAGGRRDRRDHLERAGLDRAHRRDVVRRPPGQPARWKRSSCPARTSAGPGSGWISAARSWSSRPLGLGGTASESDAHAIGTARPARDLASDRRDRRGRRPRQGRRRCRPRSGAAFSMKWAAGSAPICTARCAINCSDPLTERD